MFSKPSLSGVKISENPSLFNHASYLPRVITTAGSVQTSRLAELSPTVAK